jgi:hypothetical protein
VTRYNQDNNNNSNNNNRRLAELARLRRLHDERARAEQHERAIVDNANVPTAQMVNAIIGSIRDPLQREQALAVIQTAALERQEQEDRDKALFVSGLTGDPCDGLKYGKYPCINHRDPNVGDGTKCRPCYRNLMRNARAGMTAEERYAEKLERKRERDEERAVRAHEKRMLRQRLRNAAAHKRRVRLGLVNNTTNQHATSSSEASVHVSPCLACSADTTASARCAKRWCVPTVSVTMWLAINGVSTCLLRAWSVAQLCSMSGATRALLVACLRAKTINSSTGTLRMVTTTTTTAMSVNGICPRSAWLIVRKSVCSNWRISGAMSKTRTTTMTMISWRSRLQVVVIQRSSRTL